MRIPRGIATLVIIAAVVGSALLGQQRWRTESDTVSFEQTEQPGYSARNAELIETGADGRPLFRLDAEVIRQRSQDDSVDLDKVHMSYRGEKSSQWALTAEHGTVREGNEHIELEGNVRVVGVLPGTSDLATIRTEKLSFNTKSEVANTREPVTLAFGSREIHATGLVANLKDEHVQLESDIHGRFSP